MAVKYINREKLNNLIANLLESGNEVFAPIRNAKNHYVVSRIVSPSDIEFKYSRTLQSAKSIFFPKNEVLFSYKKSGDLYDIVKPKLPDNRKVLLGIHPCDAAAIEYMDKFFISGQTDELYRAHRENAIIISLACTESDENCFCTSVGLSPDSPSGSDVLLTPTNDGGFIAETNSDKGNAFLKDNESFFEAESEKIKKSPSVVPEVFDLTQLVEKAKSAFESPVWIDESLSCLGCGTCAYVCPTCSCFDVQDESNPSEGRRIRTWDSCGLGLFTLHASGHNPRYVQSQRWRNRVLHKFNYSIENLDMVSCVGCGRCLESCPAGMSIIETVENILEH
jgi:ferredoxin